MNMMSAHWRDGRSYPTLLQLAAAVDELAELLSQGFTLNESADRMDISRGSACVIFCDLCARYGEQARL